MCMTYVSLIIIVQVYISSGARDRCWVGIKYGELIIGTGDVDGFGRFHNQTFGSNSQNWD